MSKSNNFRLKRRRKGAKAPGCSSAGPELSLAIVLSRLCPRESHPSTLDSKSSGLAGHREESKKPKQVDPLPTHTNRLCNLHAFFGFISTATTKESIAIATEEQATPGAEVGRELSGGVGTLDLVMPGFGGWYRTCMKLQQSVANASSRVHPPL